MTLRRTRDLNWQSHGLENAPCVRVDDANTDVRVTAFSTVVVTNESQEAVLGDFGLSNGDGRDGVAVRPRHTM